MVIPMTSKYEELTEIVTRLRASINSGGYTSGEAVTLQKALTDIELVQMLLIPEVVTG
jgi:hypothetical protein